MLNIAKWGIPEKSMQNIAQRRWPEVRRTLRSKVMAKIDLCIYFPLYFTLWAKKNKQHRFWTVFRPGPKGKMVQNGKIDKNPTGSSHGEQLEPKRLTLDCATEWTFVLLLTSLSLMSTPLLFQLLLLPVAGQAFTVPNILITLVTILRNSQEHYTPALAYLLCQRLTWTLLFFL